MLLHITFWKWLKARFSSLDFKQSTIHMNWSLNHVTFRKKQKRNTLVKIVYLRSLFKSSEVGLLLPKSLSRFILQQSFCCRYDLKSQSGTWGCCMKYKCSASTNTNPQFFSSSRKISKHTCSNKWIIYNIIGFYSPMVCHDEWQTGIHACISNKVSLFYTVGLNKFSLAICNLLKELKSLSVLRYKR